MRMILIPVIGKIQSVEVTDVQSKRLDAMRRLIGAEWIERVRVGDSLSLAVDEEGIRNFKVPNPRASVLYGQGRVGEWIYGDALLAKEGRTHDGVDWLHMDDDLHAQMMQRIGK